MLPKIKTLIRHILLFVVVEFLFILIIFHELPPINLVTLIGIGHLAYWLLMPIFGRLHERVHSVWAKFLVAYTPIVLHVLLHVIVVAEVVSEHSDEIGTAHEHEILRMIIGTIVAGVVIFIGEYLLHRTTHCETHHHSAHQHCCEDGHGECEERHGDDSTTMVKNG
ncbi:MAG: hypothetical protein H6766_00680 [Candidatus Peribacteria bacterium]|nr:MAG: hypothetical protein H6766_00680 [Candidatus Peribacteria bacterium]